MAIKVMQSALKDKDLAVTGVWPVAENFNIPASTAVSVLCPVRITHMPVNRNVVTWFMAATSTGGSSGLVQTAGYETGATNFNFPRSGTLKVNGIRPTDTDKVKYNQWFIAEIWTTGTTDIINKINFGAPEGGNNMPSSEWAVEDLSIYIGSGHADAIAQETARLKAKYGIS